MNYSKISGFGSNTYSAVNNPLTYCIGNTMDQRFLHGGASDTLGQNSRSCQLFMSEYCSDKWDDFCEIASKSTTRHYPNQSGSSCSGGGVACAGLTAGESLIRSTAERKYLHIMHGSRKKYEPFDPTVPTSPLISYWVSDQCSQYSSGVPEYRVDGKTIDSDIVMDKILRKPSIAPTILVNIFNTMKRHGDLSTLNGTKLGNYYITHPYFKVEGSVLA